MHVPITIIRHEPIHTKISSNYSTVLCLELLDVYALRCCAFASNSEETAEYDQ